MQYRGLWGSFHIILYHPITSDFCSTLSASTCTSSCLLPTHSRIHQNLSKTWKPQITAYFRKKIINLICRCNQIPPAWPLPEPGPSACSPLWRHLGSVCHVAMILSTKRFLCMNVPHLQCPFPSPSLRWSLSMLHSITAVLPGNLRFFEDPFPLSDNQFCSSAESSELQFVLCFCLLSVLWMPEGKNCIFF